MIEAGLFFLPLSFINMPCPHIGYEQALQPLTHNFFFLLLVSSSLPRCAQNSTTTTDKIRYRTPHQCAIRDIASPTSSQQNERGTEKYPRGLQQTNFLCFSHPHPIPPKRCLPHLLRPRPRLWNPKGPCPDVHLGHQPHGPCFVSWSPTTTDCGSESTRPNNFHHSCIDPSSRSGPQSQAQAPLDDASEDGFVPMSGHFHNSHPHITSHHHRRSENVDFSRFRFRTTCFN